MDADIAQIPVWVVQGKNWLCEVPLDEHNAQFSSILQAEEAGTRAIEQIKGQDRSIEIKSDDKVIDLGGIIIVYPVGMNPKVNSFWLMVHELLANGGYYTDSIKVETETKKFIEEQAKLEEQALKELEALDVPEKKKTEKPKAKRKPKTPKPKEDTKPKDKPAGENPKPKKTPKKKT